ncbi:MAG: hypothetical protein BWY57_03104 [Betaproteobacteria bacterium ADurb.Bin341]|nr:MAG: hypothetical protein BWY57_03104 [Betaproteobacteria bacterium ADurb.Bin341]
MDFALPYFQQWVRDKIEERDAGVRATNAAIATDEEAAAASAASNAPKVKGPEAAISDLEADMRLLQKTGMQLTAKSITPEAMNAINANLPVSITAEEAATRINEAMENGEELKIGKIFQPTGSTANTKPMSATNTFTVDDTLSDLAALKQRALVGINVNPDKLPASVQGVVDDAFVDELTNAIKTDDEMAIRRLFDEAAQRVQDAANAPSPGIMRAEEATMDPVPLKTLVGDLQALKRFALSGQAIPDEALTEAIVSAVQAVSGSYEDAADLLTALNAMVERGDTVAIEATFDPAIEMLENQAAEDRRSGVWGLDFEPEEWKSILSVEPELLPAEASPAAPVKKWDWADYYTKQSSMSETDFTRYRVEIQDGLLEYLKTGETTNAGALSFMESYGDLFEGARLGFDNLGREVNVDLRKKYGNTIINALDAINMDYVAGDQYIEAIFAASQAYEEAMSAEVAPEASEVLARDAEMQRLIDEGLIHPSEAYTVRRDSPEDVAAAQADAYFAENPQALETIINVAETSKATAAADEANRLAEQKALQDQAIAEREAFIETAVPTALEAFEAVNAGTADDNQSAIVRSARMVVTDTVRAQDDTYVKMYTQVVSLASGGFDPEMAPSATYEERAQYSVGIAVGMLAMNTVDDHLGIAKNLNMTLSEFYELFPELYVSPEQLVERAQEEYTSAWLAFGNGLDAQIDAAYEIMEREEAQDKANQYDPEAVQSGGIGMMKAIGMGVETGWETHRVGWLDMFEAYCVMGVEGLDQEFNLRTAYDTRKELYTDISAATAGVKDETFRTDLEQELASTVDIYNFPLSPEAIRARDKKIELQNNINAAAKIVAEHATPMEQFAFGTTQMLTNTGMTMTEFALLNAATGASAGVGFLPSTMRAISGALTFGGAEGAEMALNVYEKTGDRKAAVGAGYGVSAVIGWANSQQAMNLKVFGQGMPNTIQAAFKAGAAKLAIQNPGAFGRLANVLAA